MRTVADTPLPPTIEQVNQLLAAAAKVRGVLFAASAMPLADLLVALVAVKWDTRATAGQLWRLRFDDVRDDHRLAIPTLAGGRVLTRVEPQTIRVIRRLWYADRTHVFGGAIGERRFVRCYLNPLVQQFGDCRNGLAFIGKASAACCELSGFAADDARRPTQPPPLAIPRPFVDPLSDRPSGPAGHCPFFLLARCQQAGVLSSADAHRVKSFLRMAGCRSLAEVTAAAFVAWAVNQGYEKSFERRFRRAVIRYLEWIGQRKPYLIARVQRQLIHDHYSQKKVAA